MKESNATQFGNSEYDLMNATWLVSLGIYLLEFGADGAWEYNRGDGVLRSYLGIVDRVL